MLEQLIETGKKICTELEDNKKGKKLERTTWVATSLRYLESHANHSAVNDILFDLDLLNDTLNREDAILLTALLKAEFEIEKFEKPPANRCMPTILVKSME